MLNVTEALLMVARSTFRPMADVDYYGYAGAESENPMIAESGDYVIIIDGEIIFFENVNDGSWFNFNVNPAFEG